MPFRSFSPAPIAASALWKAAVFSAKEIPFPLIEDVSSSVDEAQQLGPESVHGASDLLHARKMVMAG